MKRNFLRTLAIATGMLAMSFWGLTASYGQASDQPDIAPSRQEGIGCYTTHVLDCGFQLGQQLLCNFTGSYGAPYQCTSFGCYGSQNTRHCVQPS